MRFKKNIIRLFQATLIAIGAIIIIYAVLYYLLGMRVNNTRSVARGIYWSVDEVVSRGQYVTFCPPDTEVFQMARERGYISIGFCPNNYSGLIKFVAGVPGDIYRFNEDGLYINGSMVPNTQPIEQDNMGNKLFALNKQGRLEQGEYILMGNAVANSFDARYYGIVSQEHIKDVVVPLLVEE